MADYLRHLYMDPHCAGMEKKIRRAIRTGKDIPGIRVITLSSNGVDQLDIISLSYLRQKQVRENLPLVVGFADGKEGALELVRQMTEDTYRATGRCDMRSYLPEADSRRTKGDVPGERMVQEE